MVFNLKSFGAENKFSTLFRQTVKKTIPINFQLLPTNSKNDLKTKHPVSKRNGVVKYDESWFLPTTNR